MADRLGVLLGISEAKAAVDEQRGGGDGQNNGGGRRSRLQGATERLRRGAGRAASSARSVGQQTAADARRAARALDRNELQATSQAGRRRGIPELTAREARERDMADNAVRASVMGAPVRATLEPVTRPEDMQFFVTGMGQREPVDEAAGMGIVDLLPGGGRPEDRGARGLEMGDPLGAGVAMGGGQSGGGDAEDEPDDWLEFDSFLGGDD